MTFLLCKMTSRTFEMTDLVTTLNLNSLQHLTFCVVFNKTLRASKASEASEAGGPVQADQTA